MIRIIQISVLCLFLMTWTNVLAQQKGEFLFYESFDQCSGTGGNDDMWNGNIAKAAFNADNDGWISAKSYGANQCARFGTSSIEGLVTTPQFSLDGKAILSFRAAPWDGDGAYLQIRLNDDNLQELELVPHQWNDFSLEIEYNGRCVITFVPMKRLFLDEVKIVAIADTHIQEVLNSKDNASIQTVSGQCVGTIISQLPKGVYVKNRKKILVR